MIRLLTFEPAPTFRPGIDVAIPLADAMLCADCDTLTPAALGRCACFVRPVADRRAA